MISKISILALLYGTFSLSDVSVHALRGASAQRELAIGFDLAQVCQQYRLDHSLLPEVYGDYSAEIDVDVEYLGADAYWGVTFNDAFYDSAQKQAWCGNLELKMSEGSYKVDVWSSYSHPDFQTEAVDKQQLLFQVAWMINNYVVGMFAIFPATGNLQAHSGIITYKEFQLAIWYLIDDGPHWDNSIAGVDFLLAAHLATEAGAVAEYEPDCTDPNERLLVVLIFDNNKERIKQQTILVDYLLADTDICICDDSDNVVTEDPGGKGDPHFKTWAGDRYDFHGACDLVLLQNPAFHSDLGMDINIRTKRTKAWSYISSAVVRIGTDLFEVRGSGEDDEGVYWLNGVPAADLSKGISGFKITHVKQHAQQHAYTIELGGKTVVSIKTFKLMVSVNLEGGKRENFGESLGLMGSFDGEWLGRDGKTVIADPIALGLEWQVRADEQFLFVDVEGIQAPEKCEVPSDAAISRRLEEVEMTLEEAELACSRVNKGDRDLCIFDVLATNDKELAGAY